MRIAEIAPPWFPVPPEGYGGTERIVASLADGLADRGHDVTLFASGGSTTRAELVSPLAVPPEPRDLGNVWDDVFHAFSAYLRAGEFDLIHDHSGMIGPALGAMLDDRPPVVHTLHGPWTPQSRRLYALLDRRIELVAISGAQMRANTTARYAGVVHNGLDPSLFTYRADKDDFLTFLGRSSPDKGPVQAIEIAERMGLPLHLMIKCNEPDEIEYWNRAIEPRLSADIHVVRNAPHDVKVDLLSRSRALLFPIQWDEPFGLAMIEALACGTPVLASARGSVPEIVIDGESGFHLDPLDTVRSAVSMLARLDAIEPAACRARFEHHFSAAHMVQRYERVFEQLAPARLTAELIAG